VGRAPISSLEGILEILFEHQIARHDIVHHDLVFVHPSNRGGLGLNPFNAHRNGASMKTVCCDPKELDKSMVIEMSPCGPLMSKQMNFNKHLINASKGMLAQPTQRERVVSWGGGNSFAFFRAAAAGCSTPQPVLADADRKLSAAGLRKDARMAQCLDHGWRCRVLPLQCEVVWNLLPDLAQRALNASNNVMSQCSALEVCRSIAECDAMREAGTSFGDCVQAVAQSSPPCVGCVGKLCELVRTCGGGDGVPYIKFPIRISSVYGENKTFGEEFLTAVVDLNASDFKRLVQIQVALCVASLSGPKVVDRVAKTLTKADVQMIKAAKAIDAYHRSKKDFGIATRLYEEGTLTKRRRTNSLASDSCASLCSLLER